MEDYIQKVELINKYLNKTLSKKEIQNFENRLRADTAFKKAYEMHVLFLEGLKRQLLKSEIQKAERYYIRNKWIKYFGFISAVIVLCALIYFNAFNADRDYLKSKLNFESEYIQNFQVATDSIVEIIGEKGTTIRFNPKDLETSSNKPFIGDSLNIELIELINKQDLLFTNAQTVSNNKWLVSGGAFKIDIMANGELLALKEDKTIDVQFPRNTLEEGLRIFYGGRDEENNMTWEASKIKLKPFPFVIAIGHSSISIINEELTILYGVDTTKELDVIDSLGRIELKKEFPKINYFDEKADTIRVHKKRIALVQKGRGYDKEYFYGNYEVIEIDSLPILKGKNEIRIDSILIDLKESRYLEGEVASAYAHQQISKSGLSELENVISKNDFQELEKKYYSKTKEGDYLHETLDKIYQTVQLSKLGWINIDKFAREEEKVTVKLNFNVKTNHNEIYVIDQKNNTVLNVYNDEVDLPVNRSFYIIAVGIKGKDIYGFKKSVRFSKNNNLKIDFKKINETQIKSILTLEDSMLNKNVGQFKKNEVYNQTIVKIKDEVIESDKALQVFKINPKKDTVIVCTEGAKLIIKANSFVDQNNDLVTGKVDVKVKEYYKLLDIMIAYLTTPSNGKQLETGSMLYIEALKGDELLKLKQGSSIEILFPVKRKKKDTQLFIGEWEGENIKWKLQKEQEPEINDSLIENIEIAEVNSSDDVQIPFTVVEQMPIYPGCERNDEKQQRKCTSDSINKFVQRRFNTEVAKELGFNGKQRINSTFGINQNGNIVSIQTKANHPLLEDEAKRVIALLPKMKPGIQRGQTVMVTYSLPILFQVGDYSGRAIPSK